MKDVRPNISVRRVCRVLEVPQSSVTSNETDVATVTLRRPVDALRVNRIEELMKNRIQLPMALSATTPSARRAQMAATGFVVLQLCRLPSSESYVAQVKLGRHIDTLNNLGPEALCVNP